LAISYQIPNKDFDDFLGSFGTIIDGTQFGYYQNDKKMGPDFKTEIQNGTRHAIVRLEQHLPFKSKISFGEEKISFAISYRKIEIKKMSPKSELLKPTVTCTNHPPFHPPIHPSHPPFMQNIKTVSQNGTAADHNAVSFPAGIDSFTGACGKMKVGT
jgi:hypothetical protein